MFVVVYVPTSRLSDDRTSRTAVDNAVCDCLTVFGGMTEVDGTGSWVDDDGEVIREAVRQYQFATAYGTLSADEGIAIRTVVNALLSAGELAVAVIIDNNLRMFTEVDPELLPIVADQGALL